MRIYILSLNFIYLFIINMELYFIPLFFIIFINIYLMYLLYGHFSLYNKLSLNNIYFFILFSGIYFINYIIFIYLSLRLYYYILLLLLFN